MGFLLTHTPLLYFTQSLWRDEAFSVLLSERSPFTFIRAAFEPPFYYFLLHFWMKIFGNSEIAVRSLSLLGFTLATVVVIYWAEHLFPKHWLSWFLPLFFFLNPMLLYYGFEVRAYAWYMFFAVVSMYAYTNNRWKLYVLGTTLGMYTHTYMVLIPVCQMFHYLITHRSLLTIKGIRGIHKDPMIRSVAATIILFSPWLIKVIQEMGRLRESWYFPVDMQLVRSVLGNIFVGYEGTPWFLWRYTRIISFILLVLFGISLIPARTRARNSYFLITAIVPLILVIGISFYKPLFVNRYLIFSSIAEVFLVVFAIAAIKNAIVQKILAVLALSFVVFFNLWYPDKHPKLDIRSTLEQINALMTKHDVILADSSLVFFESIYYSRDRSRVFLYTPDGSAFPWYVGDLIVSPHQIVRDIPPYPVRAYIVHENGTYSIAYDAPTTSGQSISSKKP